MAACGGCGFVALSLHFPVFVTPLGGAWPLGHDPLLFAPKGKDMVLTCFSLCVLGPDLYLLFSENGMHACLLRAENRM